MTREFPEKETQVACEKDALLDLIGAGGDLETATDVASNHHRYLALDLNALSRPRAAV